MLKALNIRSESDDFPLPDIKKEPLEDDRVNEVRNIIHFNLVFIIILLYFLVLGGGVWVQLLGGQGVRTYVILVLR